MPLGTIRDEYDKVESPIGDPWSGGATPPATGEDDKTQIPFITPSAGEDPGDDFGGTYPWRDIGAYEGPTRLDIQFGSAPRFTAPRFNAPTAESVLTEPGYAFGRDQGLQALQQAQAAKGILRTGGSLKDLIGWGVNYASQKYDDAFTRALRGYDAEFNAAKSEYAPLMQEWLTKAGATQASRLAEFERAWNEYTFLQSLLEERDRYQFKADQGTLDPPPFPYVQR